VVGLIALTLLTQDERQLIPDTPLAPAPASARPKWRLPLGTEAIRSAAALPGFVPVAVVLFLAQFVDRSFGPILPLYVANLGTPDGEVASYAGTIISLAAVGTAVSAAG